MLLSLLLLPVLNIPPAPSADTIRAVWLADLDPAHVAELVVPGPLPATRQLQCFSLPVPSSATTLCVSGAEV